MKKTLFTSLIATVMLLAGCGGDEPEVKNLVSISVSGQTCVYYVNDTFSFDGVLTAKYDDNSSKQVEPSYVSSPDMSKEGEKEVVVTYTENNITKGTSYTIDVLPNGGGDKSIIAIHVKDAPKDSYNVGDYFDPTGLSITIDFDDQSNDEVSYAGNENRFTFTPSLSTALSESNTYVTIGYGKENVNFPITVLKPSSKVDFNEVKDEILISHNYSIKITSYLMDKPEDVNVSNYYNINNQAYYGIHPSYPILDHGFIIQKGQGIVTFDRVNTSSEGEVIPDYFVTTDPSKKISDIYDYMIEHILSASFTKEENSDKYVSKDTKACQIAAGLSGYETTYMVASDKVYGYTSDGDYPLIISSDFEIYYIDDNYDQQHVQGMVKIEVYDIGSTHNSAIEAYIANPTTTFDTPTKWSDDDVSLFNSYFNNTTAPFISGLSYSYDCYPEYDGYNQCYYISIEDGASGDLRNAYGKILEDNDYEKVSGKYVLEIPNESNTLKDVYSIEMTFFSPTTTIGGTDQKYGDLYPNGLMYFRFLYQQKVVYDVNSVASFNAYIATTDAKDVLPAFPDNGKVTKITDFDDRTAFVSQLYETDQYLFVTSVASANVKFYIESYADALSYINQLLTVLASKGFNHVEKALGMIGVTDAYDSKIIISDIEYGGKDSYKGYFQIGICIYVASKPADLDTKTAVGISIKTNPTKTQYIEGNEFDPSGLVITVLYDDKSTKDVPYDTNANKFSFLPNGKLQTTTSKIVVTYEDVSCELPITVIAKSIESLEVVSPKTNYTVGEEFVKPTVKALYNNGDLEDVTASCEFSGFDSSKEAENQVITVKYGKTTTSYTINISEKKIETYSITFTNITGVTFKLISPSSANEIAAGTEVAFSAKANEGYTITSVSVKCNGVDVPYDTSLIVETTKTFTMPEGDVVISATVSKDGEDYQYISGTYKFAKNSYVDMQLVFTADGNGQYLQYRNNNDNHIEAILNFTYTIDKDGKITIAFVDYGTKSSGSKSDNTDFSGGSTGIGGLRLFSDIPVEGDLNSTGVYDSAADEINISTYDSSGTAYQRTFSK